MEYGSGDSAGNPYQAPQTSAQPEFAGTWRDADLVVVPPQGVLAAFCVVCGEPSQNRCQRAVSFTEATWPPTGKWLFHCFVLFVFGVGSLVLLAQLSGFPVVQQHLVGFMSIWCLTNGGMMYWAQRQIHADLPREPITFWFCQRHYFLHQLANYSLRSFCCCLLVAIVIWELRFIIPLETQVVLRIGILACLPLFCVTIFAVLMNGVFNPTLEKADEAGNRWIRGLPAAYLDLLPAWSETGSRPHSSAAKTPPARSSTD